MSRDPEVIPTRAQAFAEWYFSDANGERVLGQPPNRAITIVFGLQVSRWVLRRGGLREASPLDVALERVGRAVFIWWSLDEILRGATPYRRTIGAVSLLYALRRGRREA